MARFARVVVPNFPHHLTCRGNRREPVFFSISDRQRYKSFLHQYSEKWGMDIGAYCFMDNHVHLIAVPTFENSFAKSIGITNMRYARHVNDGKGWSGHLWSGRYFSTPLGRSHFQAAIRYVELNPVRAGLVDCAEDYGWSSARSHVEGTYDPLLAEDALFGLEEEIGDWSSWLREGLTDKDLKKIRECTKTGRPCGTDAFLDIVEKAAGRSVRKAPVGRKRRRRDRCSWDNT
jgi:putative transposase